MLLLVVVNGTEYVECFKEGAKRAGEDTDTVVIKFDIVELSEVYTEASTESLS